MCTVGCEESPEVLLYNTLFKNYTGLRPTQNYSNAVDVNISLRIFQTISLVSTFYCGFAEMFAPDGSQEVYKVAILHNSHYSNHVKDMVMIPR